MLTKNRYKSEFKMDKLAWIFFNEQAPSYKKVNDTLDNEGKTRKDHAAKA